MATTKVILPVKSLLTGIANARSLEAIWPTAVDLLDMRVLGGALERIGFTLVSGEPITYVSRGKLVRVGADVALISDCVSHCDMEYRVYYQTTAGETKSLDWTLAIADESLLSWRFVSMHGAFGLLNYMSPGVLGISKPGQYPAIALPALPSGRSYEDYSGAVDTGMVYMKVAKSTLLYGAHPFGDGCLVYGNGSVVKYTLRENAAAGVLHGQIILSSVGLLSRDAWAGHEKAGFFIGQDRQLYKIDEKGACTMLGFGHLWPTATRARLHYIPESGELFILVDQGSDTVDGFVSPKGYLLSQGLTRLSVAPASACFNAGKISILGTDGMLYSIEMPQLGEEETFDWATYTPNATPPSRDPDLVTDFADFGTAWDKRLCGVQFLELPMWPVWIKVEMPSGSATNMQTLANPMAAFSLSEKLFRISVWFPSYIEAGAIMVKEARIQIEGDDQRGIYAATQATSGQSQ